MPGFAATVVCPAVRSERRFNEQGYYDAAAFIVSNLDAMGAETLRVVSGGKVNADGLGWPVTGTTVDRELCKNRAPIYVTMTMNPLYGGFDFGALKAELHDALRRLIWNRLTRHRGMQVSACDFMVRIEFMVGAGSRVHALGEVSEEYGGDTGVVNLATA